MTERREPTPPAAPRARRQVAPVALVLALLVGTTGAFALTEKLKLEGRALTATKIRGVFSPTCDCPTRSARFVVTLRQRGTVSAEIVDEEGRHVRTLERRGDSASAEARFRWAGRDDEGRLVPDGVYRLRIRLVDKGRVILVPKRIEVDTDAPDLGVVSVRPRALAPDEDVEIAFTTDEAVRPLLLLDGEPVARARFARPGRRVLTWDGAGRGRPLAAGSHTLVLRVRDRAGNVTASAGVTVRVATVNAVYSGAAPRLPAHELADTANEGATIMSTGFRRAMEMGAAVRLAATPGGGETALGARPA